MDNITIIKDFMAKNSLRFLLVNATNEFLVEYNTLEENSRYKLTNFYIFICLCLGLFMFSAKQHNYKTTKQSKFFDIIFLNFQNYL